MDDFFYSGRLEGLGIGVSYAVTTQLVNEAVVRHNCDPYAAHILGRALTASLLASVNLSPGERLNLQWKYQGAVRTVLVDVGADASARGLIAPAQLAEFGETAQAFFGDRAEVQAVRSKGARVLNSGAAECRLQDVVEDLAYFHAISDQTEVGMVAVIGFAPRPESPVRICRGIRLQAMPDTDLAVFDALRRRLYDDRVRRLLVRQSETDSRLENVVNALCEACDLEPCLRYRERPAPVFRCTCSRDKMSAVLRTLPVDEREQILRDNESLTVHCRFCNERYRLTPEDCRRAWGANGA